MILLSFAVMGCTFCIIFVMNIQRKILAEQRSIEASLKEIHLLMVVASKAKVTSAITNEVKEPSTGFKPAKGANRKPRTEEQRLQASLDKKAYWAAKRAEKAGQVTQPSQGSPQAVNA